MISSQGVKVEENKIFDNEWMTHVQTMGIELHIVTAALKITIKKCAELEKEIRQVQNYQGFTQGMGNG